MSPRLTVKRWTYDNAQRHVAWRRFDQSAKQLIVGHTTIHFHAVCAPLSPPHKQIWARSSLFRSRAATAMARLYISTAVTRCTVEWRRIIHDNNGDRARAPPSPLDSQYFTLVVCDSLELVHNYDCDATAMRRRRPCELWQPYNMLWLRQNLPKVKVKVNGV